MTLRPILNRSLVSILIGLAGACDGLPVSPENDIRGSWGGPGFGLEVSSDSARAVFTCAYGTLKTPIALDFDGRFSTSGEYVREVGPAALRDAARYEGRVSGSAIVLTVVVTDTIGLSGTYTVGPFAGTRDRKPEVFHCQ